MVDYLHKPVEHEAFFKKYASKKFLKGMIINRSSCQPITDKDSSVDRDESVGQTVLSVLP